MRPLQEGECPAYYFTYSNLVPEGDLLDLLKENFKETENLFDGVSETDGDYRYADGKWTLKEVLIHMIDVEHIMGCRALRIARNDKSALPSFDENEFVNNLDVSSRTVKDLMEEFTAMRKLTIEMFKHFDDAMLDRIGTVSGNNMSALALAYCIIGHETHHRNVINERYLSRA